MNNFRNICRKQILSPLIIIFFSLLFSCINNPNENKQTSVKQRTDSTVQKTSGKNDTVKKDTLNVVDKYNRKQGKWIEKHGWLKDTSTTICYYKDGLKNGPYKLLFNGIINCSGYFNNGKLNGQWKRYIDGEYYSICEYVNGKCKWMAWPCDYLFPCKGPDFSKDLVDSIYLKVPYDNGVIWYEGLFIKTDSLHKLCKGEGGKYYGKGIHKMYYNNGNPKAIFNFDSIKVNYYDDSLSLKFRKYSFMDGFKGKGGCHTKFVLDKVYQSNIK